MLGANNIIKKDTLRQIQKETLNTLKECLVNSFGPMGSNTIISQTGQYTKDGHSILDAIMLVGPIECQVKDNIRDITRDTVKKVGDGTTSAVILANAMFNKLNEMEVEKTPYDIIRDIKRAVEILGEEIESRKQEFTIEDVKRITMIATNGNKQITDMLYEIYKEYGIDVYIDVTISMTEETMVKIYDGMTLDTGYSDPIFANAEQNKCRVPNATVYQFDDPIDTPEMANFLDKIVMENIIGPLNSGRLETLVPTVIMAPKISRDMCPYMERLCDTLAKVDPMNRPPFMIIVNIRQGSKYADIGTLCGCKPIRKYINPEQQQNDIEMGIAPTLDNITTFGGQCELVEATPDSCKFVNPKRMYNEDGEYTEVFNNLIKYLETELDRVKEEGNINKIGDVKRRIQSLKANMVELLVGGVTIADRDADRHLIEDAVLSCRSAAKSGYGYACNFEGYRAADRFCKLVANGEAGKELDELGYMFDVIKHAYEEVLETLYDVSKVNVKPVEVLENGCPFNVKTKEFDQNIIGSIEADKVILEAISKIVSLMITSNQFLCNAPQYNTYNK